MPPQPPRAVLDTNVLLDWLVFADARCRPLVQALQAGQLHWHASPAMRLEFAQVLQRPMLQKWRPNAEHALTSFDAWAHLEPEPTPGPIPAALRCSDADDQKFIDLALALGARWLLSRDRAVLKLSRAARLRGVDVLTPEAWAKQWPCGGPQEKGAAEAAPL